MTVEEYRQRMINAFHNADCDNLIALVALPTEKEFEHLEWLLKNHYHNQKQEPCDDCISRQAVLDEINKVGVKGFETYNDYSQLYDFVDTLHSVTPKEKTGWIPVSERLPEEKQSVLVWCPQYKNIYCAYLEGNQWWIFGAFVQIVPNEVIAWMPLPKRYKEGE